MVKITWLAHSCFIIENEEGARLLMDPYDETAGYEVPRLKADVITVSHRHADHSNLKMVQGEYTLFDTAGSFAAKGFGIRGIETSHDESNGSERGKNIVYVVECENLRICHLGDLGHRLDREQLDAIGNVDILMIPVGGTYTIDAATACDVTEEIGPRAVLPMHFKTPALSYPLEDGQRFLALMRTLEYTLIVHHSPSREFDAKDLPRRRAVIVLDHMY
jgi:L-ascorbate metabolism protein UlaG (beta-lactamase superfamily)